MPLLKELELQATPFFTASLLEPAQLYVGPTSVRRTKSSFVRPKYNVSPSEQTDVPLLKASSLLQFDPSDENEKAPSKILSEKLSYF